jgi:hypothetical protein
MSETAAAETLDAFVGKGWSDHADDAEGVWKRLPRGLDLAKEGKHLAALCALAVHVSGEHLGRWDDGIAFLERMEKHRAFDARTPEGKAVVRGKAVLHHGAGRAAECARCEEASRVAGPPAASNRVRVLATVSSAYANLGRIADAKAALDEALALCAYGPGKDDPAARSLAITGNNLAAALENTPKRTKEQAALMVQAAEVGLRFWAVAGGPTETARAHYRLSRSLAHAGDGKRSTEHAKTYLGMAPDTGDPLDAFSAHEALAWARLVAKDRRGAEAEREAASRTLSVITDPDSKSMAETDLKVLDSALAK